MAAAGMYGLPGLLGVILRGSLEIGIPFAGEDISETVYGVYGGIADKFFGAVDAIDEGRYYAGVEKAAPVFAENIMKAGRWAVTGTLTDAKARPLFDERGKKMEPTAGDIVRQGLSFRPTTQAELSEEKQSYRSVKAYYDEWRDNIYINYRAAKNKEERAKVQEDVRKYNQKAKNVDGIPRITFDMLNQARNPKPNKGLMDFMRD